MPAAAAPPSSWPGFLIDQGDGLALSVALQPDGMVAVGSAMGKGAIFSPEHEAWRNHPMLKVKYRQMFPGLGYATAIFATYCAGEWFYNRFAGRKGGHH